MEFVAIAFAVFLVKEVVTLVKQLSARHFREAATLVIAFAGGVGVAFLFCAAKVAATVEFGSIALASLDGASKVLFGLELGATASFGYGFLKSIDSSRSGAEPRLAEGVSIERA